MRLNPPTQVMSNEKDNGEPTRTKPLKLRLNTLKITSHKHLTRRTGTRLPMWHTELPPQ